MKIMVRMTLAALLLLGIVRSAWAQLPEKISYQGMLKDNDGGPANGIREMSFRLYGSETGGTSLWEERQSVDVKDGLFSTLLGSVAPITLSFDAPYWLEVVVDGATFSPRTPLTSAPYSLNARSVAEGVAVTGLNGLTDTVRLIGGTGIHLDVDEEAKTITINANGRSDFSLPYEDSVAAPGKAAFKVRNTSSSGRAIVAEAKGGFAIEAAGWQGISVRGGKPAKVNPGGEGIGVDIVGAEGSAVHVGYANFCGLFVSEAGSAGAWVFESGGTGFRVTKAAKSGFMADSVPLGVDIIKADTGVKLGDATVGVVVKKAKDAGVSVLQSEKIGVSVGKAAEGAFVAGESRFGLTVGKADIGVKIENVSTGMTIKTARQEGIRVEQAATGVFVNHADTFAFRAGEAEFGLIIGNARFEGVNVQNSGSSGFGVERCAYAGLKVVSAHRGVDVWTVSGDAFAVDTAGGDGLYVRKAFENGVHILKSVGAGVKVDTTEADGLFIKRASMSGVRVVSAAEDGVHIAGASRHGLIVDTAGSDGLHIADAGEYGVFASGRLGAGFFSGDVTVTGTLAKASGTFKIDHPQDPLNKYLYHSFVESPDMMNVYNGIAMLDDNGEGWVDLPSYFESLNREFRYQLTAMGRPGPNLYVAEEIRENRFRIAGGTPGMKVSWQVTGVRKDPYAEMHRVQVEVEKPAKERGTYLHPEAYGATTTP